MSVSHVAGQLPPVFFICLIISSLWLRSFLHLWGGVCVLVVCVCGVRVLVVYGCVWVCVCWWWVCVCHVACDLTTSKMRRLDVECYAIKKIYNQNVISRSSKL